MYARAARGLLSFFGVGYVPWMPGTCGSLAAVILWPVIRSMPHILGCACVLLCLILGLYALSLGDVLAEDKDPAWVVWDEACAVGMIPLLFPEAAWTDWAAVWILFRVFDIVKPWPIGLLETCLPKNYAVFADDIGAVFAAALTYAFYI